MTEPEIPAIAGSTDRDSLSREPATSAAASTSNEPHSLPHDARTIALLWIACVAQFLVVLDVSVVNVALPSIRTDLGFSPTTLQWVVVAYALTSASCLLLGGRLADIIGIKRSIVGAFVIFSVASLAGGLASSGTQLLVARAVQGVGAAILAPSSLTLLTTGFAQGPLRNRALAIWSACALAGGSAGSMIGGFLTQLLSWHWVLLINAPIGVVAIAAGMRYLPKDRLAGQRPGLDLPGAILATAGFGLLIYGITLIELRGLRDLATIAVLVAAPVTIAIFLLVEGKVAKDPVMPLRLFRFGSLASGNTVMVLAGAAMVPMWYFLSLLMQNVLGYGPLTAGFGFLPHTFVTAVVAVKVTPWLMDRVQHWKIIVGGCIIAAIGFTFQAMVDPMAGYFISIALPGIVFSAGSGLLMTPLTNIATVGIPRNDAGVASGILNTSRQLGGITGLAVMVAVVAGSFANPNSAEGIAAAFGALGIGMLLTAAVAFVLLRRPRLPAAH